MTVRANVCAILCLPCLCLTGGIMVTVQLFGGLPLGPIGRIGRDSCRSAGRHRSKSFGCRRLGVRPFGRRRFSELKPWRLSIQLLFQQSIIFINTTSSWGDFHQHNAR